MSTLINTPRIIAVLLAGALITIVCSSCGQNPASDAPPTNLSSKEQQTTAAQSYEAAKAAAKANTPTKKP